MAWAYQKFGTIDDPIHKSHVQSITGDYGCLKSFRYVKELEAAGKPRENETECNGKLCSGTATHEAIARALCKPAVRKKLLTGQGQVTAEHCRKVYDEEYARAVGSREVRWYGKDDAEESAAESRALMITGALNDMHHHVSEVVFIEAGFIVKIGDYWCSGHTDLVYRNRAGELALADWKTGATKPAPIELDHSWESGIYSAALRDGIWIERDWAALPGKTPNRYMREREALERELIRVAKVFAEGNGELPVHASMPGEFPADIRYVHLADYPPYKRAGKKLVKRPEECAFHDVPPDTEVKFAAGDRRGPAWYRVRRSESDIPRLQHLLRNVIGTIRMGRFFESVGEKCERCQFKTDCLTAGYEVRGEDRAQLETALKGLDLKDDGLGDVA